MICLYKSWGNPAGAILNLGISSDNDLENSVDHVRYLHHKQDRLSQNEDTEQVRRHPKVSALRRDNAVVGDNVAHEIHANEVLQAKKQILELQRKIQELEGRIPRKYPDVTFLNYKNRKRILVSWRFFSIITVRVTTEETVQYIQYLKALL